MAAPSWRWPRAAGSRGLAEERGLPLVRVPGGLQPRASLGWLATAVLATLEACGLCGPLATDVDEAAAVLRSGHDAFGVAAGEEAGNEAKALGRRLHGRLAVIYGAGVTAPVARRWKTQINENAKAPAFWAELPELDHNELEGWAGLPHVTAATEVVLLEDESGAERLRRRAELTAAELTARGAAVTRVQHPRRVGARAGLLAGAARRLRLVLPGDALWGRSDPRRRHPGLQAASRRR